MLFWDIGIRPFLNSTADNEGERGEKNIYFYSFEYYPMKFTGKYELHVILHRYLGYLLIFFNFPFRSTKHVIPKVQSFWLDNIIALYFI